MCHTWSGSGEADSFVQVSKGLYVSSPEACFLQLARQLSLVELVEVGFEFCGTYGLSDEAPRGFETRKPLATKRSLERYLTKSSGQFGVKKALKALGYVVENSASPMETMLVLLLCLPTYLGGYGFEHPQLNYQIEVLDHRLSGRKDRWCVCDLYWPCAKLALEYDSDMFHTDSGRIARDSDRRSDLLGQRIALISVTRQQVFDARMFDRLTNTLAKCLNKRHISVRPDILSRRYELRQELIERIRSRARKAGNPIAAEYIDL